MAESKPGTPGGSANTDSATIFRGRDAKQRAMAAIEEAAKELPIPTKHPEQDPTNNLLDIHEHMRKAPTVPTEKKNKEG